MITVRNDVYTILPIHCEAKCENLQRVSKRTVPSPRHHRHSKHASYNSAGDWKLCGCIHSFVLHFRLSSNSFWCSSSESVKGRRLSSSSGLGDAAPEPGPPPSRKHNSWSWCVIRFCLLGGVFGNSWFLPKIDQNTKGVPFTFRSPANLQNN